MNQRRHNRIKGYGLIMSLVILTCVICVGCGKGKDANGSMKAEDGRRYAGTIYGKPGEPISTAFFDIRIDEACKYHTFQFDDGLYKAEEGQTYLAVKVTIKNTYEKDIPISITDFILNYDGNNDEKLLVGYGKAEIQRDDFMDNLFTLKQGDSITKYILYIVPEKEQYTVNYTEYYEDHFEGNHFVIETFAEQ